MKSMEELNAARERARDGMWVRDDNFAGPRVRVSMGDCGIAAGARDVLDAFTQAIAAAKLEAQVLVTDCLGLCGQEPVAQILLPGKTPVTYGKVTRERAVEIVKRHLAGGRPVAEYTVAVRDEEEKA